MGRDFSSEGSCHIEHGEGKGSEGEEEKVQREREGEEKEGEKTRDENRAVRRARRKREKREITYTFNILYSNRRSNKDEGLNGIWSTLCNLHGNLSSIAPSNKEDG